MSELQKIWRIDKDTLRTRITGGAESNWHTNYVMRSEVSDHMDLRYLVKETEKTYTVANSTDDKFPTRFRKDDYHWFFSEVDALAFLSIEAARLTARLQAAALVADQLNTSLIKAMQAAQNGQ